MTALLKRFRDETYALMRIVTGFLFLWHGSQKLIAVPLAAPDAPALIVYIGGPIELIGGIFVTIGLLTRWAAFLCSGLMAVAYWLGHGTKELLPLLNGGELAALYCFVFLFIAANGAGIWSVDAARDKSAA